MKQTREDTDDEYRMTAKECSPSWVKKAHPSKYSGK